MKKLLALCAAAALALGIAGCANEDATLTIKEALDTTRVTADYIDVLTSFTVTSSIEVDCFDTATIAVTNTAASYDKTLLSFESDDDDVATVTSAGVVEGVAGTGGSTAVTVYYDEDEIAVVPVTVSPSDSAVLSAALEEDLTAEVKGNTTLLSVGTLTTGTGLNTSEKGSYAATNSYNNWNAAGGLNGSSATTSALDVTGLVVTVETTQTNGTKPAAGDAIAYVDIPVTAGTAGAKLTSVSLTGAFINSGNVIWNATIGTVSGSTFTASGSAVKIGEGKTLENATAALTKTLAAGESVVVRISCDAKNDSALSSTAKKVVRVGFANIKLIAKTVE